jgi:hypothetical protein
MNQRRRAPRPRARYRVVVYELTDGTKAVVIDSTGAGFVAATGTVTPAGRMTGDIGGGGPDDIQEHLAELIAQKPTG